MGQSQVFFRGLAAGALGTLLGASATLYTLSRVGWIHFGDTPISSPGDWLHWAYINLGSSIPVFAALLTRLLHNAWALTSSAASG